MDCPAPLRAARPLLRRYNREMLKRLKIAVSPKGRGLTESRRLLKPIERQKRDVIRERVLTGQTHARSKEVPFGRPQTVPLRTDEVF